MPHLRPSPEKKRPRLEVVFWICHPERIIAIHQERAERVLTSLLAAEVTAGHEAMMFLGRTSESITVRYRVSGMNCAKDAAQIERTALFAGVAADAVKVSAATHIMALYVAEHLLPDVEQAVAATGYRFDRMDGQDAPEEKAAHQDPAYRRALWIIVIPNVGYGRLSLPRSTAALRGSGSLASVRRGDFELEADAACWVFGGGCG